MTKLQSYDWPGNVRELRNVIERGVILAQGGALDFDLPFTSQPEASARSSLRPDSSAGSLAQPKFLNEVEIERFERDNLLLVLEAANWKIKGPNGAAELLGVRPNTLAARIKRWGLRNRNDSQLVVIPAVNFQNETFSK